MTVTKVNSNVALMLMYLNRICQVFQDYFGELEEESIRDNFVIIYELLDETMDHGYPQTTEARILREYITQEGYRMEAAPRPPTALTNAVSWRSEGIKHRKNEIFLDVVEKLNLLVASNGTVLHSEILGAVKMKSFLSGMPELKLGLNDKMLFEATGRSTTSSKGKAVEMEDIKFHQCVRLARFETDRTISFIPPDGEFDLMTYRLATHVKPLIWVEAVVEPHSRSRIEYMVKTKSQFKYRSIANNVEIVIPVPPDVDTPSFKCSIGNVLYVPDRDAIVWTIKQFNGSREYMMRAHFGLPSISTTNTVDAYIYIYIYSALTLPPGVFIMRSWNLMGLIRFRFANENAFQNTQNVAFCKYRYDSCFIAQHQSYLSNIQMLYTCFISKSDLICTFGIGKQ
jgi:AP-1 complex subunit mu